MRLPDVCPMIKYSARKRQIVQSAFTVVHCRSFCFAHCNVGVAVAAVLNMAKRNAKIKFNTKYLYLQTELNMGKSDH